MSFPKPVNSDEQLAHLAQNGCLRSFDELAHRYQGRLVNFLRMWTSDHATAEDLTQETLLQAFRALGTFDLSRRFSTWLFVIARRLAARAAKSGRLSLLANQDPPQVAAGPDPARNLADQDWRRSIWRMIREHSSDDEFTALWLHYVEQQSLAEIAEHFSRSSGAIKMMMTRLRKRLAGRLTAAWGVSALRELAG